MLVAHQHCLSLCCTRLLLLSLFNNGGYQSFSSEKVLTKLDMSFFHAIAISLIKKPSFSSLLWLRGESPGDKLVSTWSPGGCSLNLYAASDSNCHLKNNFNWYHHHYDSCKNVIVSVIMYESNKAITITRADFWPLLQSIISDVPPGGLKVVCHLHMNNNNLVRFKTPSISI